MKKFPTGDGPEDDLPLERDIQIDGERPDSYFSDDSGDLGSPSNVQGLNRRITFVSLLLLCLVIILILLAYLDMRQRLGRIQTRGSRKVQSFSENVLDRIKSLSYQYTELDQSVTDRLSSLEKSLAAIKEDVSETRKEITGLTTSKLDQKDFEAAEKEWSAEVAKTLTAFRKDIEQQRATLEESVARVNSELGEARHTLSNLGKDLEAGKNEMAEIFHVMETIGKEAQEQEEVVSSLLEKKLDREAVDALLKDERERHQKETALLEKKLKALEEEIGWLEKEFNITEPGHSHTKAESPPRNGESVEEANSQVAPSPPEKIIEQEITQ